ncbi:MAG: alkyl hydroperoxide reductase subunit F [Bdellovibrionaceae bacterium]|nr:alkyl hydroperoxide reductase subunit F [Pseudobdellovibrionaceae bacterium]MDW8190542.1 alkyl hydroperoxide reductase subunit F [Pseudobdellovibrionaceae bacterium]
MLDLELKQQVTEIFQQLHEPLYLKIKNSNHPDHSDLVAFLKQFAECSPHLKLELPSSPSEPLPYPSFELWTERGFSGIRFSAIPTGHEFSSLVLAILHIQRKGRLPSEHLVKRIQDLPKSAHLITYVSLTCENCPEVVQNLNLISALNPRITHEMRDGQYFQKEIDQLGIMGVPTVVWNGEVIHSGRANLLSILEKLEQKFKSNSQSPEIPQSSYKNIGLYDVTVIGAGPAGVSAAIYAVRKGLKTLVITEKLGGQVSETRGIENLISVTYTEGPQLSKALLTHLEHYSVELKDNTRLEQIQRLPSGNFELHLSSHEILQSKTVIAATGAKWKKLNVPGEEEYLGRGVAYCPHCDGPFYKGKHVAVIGGGNSGVEAAIDLAGIVGQVTLIEYANQLKADKILVDKLQALPNVQIITGAKTTHIKGDNKKVTDLQYQDLKTGDTRHLTLDGIFIQIGLLPNSSVFSQIVSLNNYGEIIIDPKCRTNVPGFFAAGDVTTCPYKQIIIAMGEGAKAGLSAFEYLKLEQH